MKSFKILTFATLMSFALLFALIAQQQTGVEASAKKKIMKNVAMAALLLHGGKKILLPLPIPIPVPILKQTQPVYYEQPSYQPSYPSYQPSYSSYQPSYSSYQPSYSSYGGSHY